MEGTEIISQLLVDNRTLLLALVIGTPIFLGIFIFAGTIGSILFGTSANKGDS